MRGTAVYSTRTYCSITRRQSWGQAKIGKQAETEILQAPLFWAVRHASELVNEAWKGEDINRKKGLKKREKGTYNVPSACNKSFQCII